MARLGAVVVVFFLAAALAAEGILDPVDFLALQAVRRSLDDMPGSAFFDAWDFTADPCGFPGVYCDGNRVSALALGDPRAGSPGLTGRLDPALGRMSALTELSLILCHNQLTGGIPSFPDSSPLLRMDLKHNALSGGVPGLPGSLQYLSLAANRLTGNVDFVLPRLTRLNYLDLSMNQLQGPIPASVFTLPLSVLQLQRNFFSGLLQPTSDVTIPVVDLSYNRFWGPLSPLLAGIGQLYLNNNRFTGDVPSRLVQELVGTGGLQLLYLQHNFLTGIEISPSSSLPSGVSLCLMYNCMVPPVYAPCPIKAGTQNTRPADQCPEWRG
ncbi:unnamed protein product [Triticum turgidum subsp. durum]|uniref:Leucine-rich repeat-containing N-terminal plant-type domain-containing protein n=1 Tax=Triticum turgidum subsp. durum TaxID=4567 RepID=A0A9R0QZG6_TRITD|nr:unnamed protein product [Triticum turgidum subsp. durum]